MVICRQIFVKVQGEYTDLSLARESAVRAILTGDILFIGA